MTALQGIFLILYLRQDFKIVWRVFATCSRISLDVKEDRTARTRRSTVVESNTVSASAGRLSSVPSVSELKLKPGVVSFCEELEDRLV